MIEKLFLCSTLLYSLTDMTTTNKSKTEINQAVHAFNQSEGEAIFLQLLSSFSKDADAVISLFHKDVVIEYPYAHSLGTSSKLNYTEYLNYLKDALPGMPNLTFSNVSVYSTEDNSYVAEAHAETVIPSTGKLYKQDYVMIFKLKEGKIHFYREYWNTMAGIDAFGGKAALQKNFKKDNN